MMVIKINNVVVDSHRIEKNKTSISRSKNKKRSLKTRIWYSADDTFPVEGQDIKVFEETALRFGGIIKKVTKIPWTPKTGTDAIILLEITSDGYNSIPRRRTIIPNYTSTDAGTVVQDLITNYLSDEGITFGTIQTGGTVDNYPVEAKSCEEILNDMSDLSGFIWDVDDDKGLDFYVSTSINLEPTDAIVEGERTHFGFKYDETLDNYANKIFVYGNGVSAIAEDVTEQTSRASIEGGTGVYGFVFKDKNITTQADADSAALELLNRKKTVGMCSFSSYNRFSIGTTIPITYPKYGIAADTNFHIMSGTEKRSDGIWVYSYQLEKRDTNNFTGKVKDDGADYFRKLKKTAESGGSTTPESIIVITNATNDSLESGNSIVLDGLDVTMTDDTVVAFAFTIDLEPSIALTSTLTIRIDGIDVKNTSKYFGTTNPTNMHFTGVLPKQLAGTYAIDATLSTDTGIVSIGTEDYNMTLWVRGGQAEEGTAYPQANVVENVSLNVLMVMDSIIAITSNYTIVGSSESVSLDIITATDTVSTVLT